MNKIDNFLSHLTGVVEITTDRWLACCPAHEDKRPSLSIRVADSDKILIHCWAGCGAADILESVGMDFSALMPNGGSGKSRKPNHWHAAREGFKILEKELLFVVMVAESIVGGKGITMKEKERLFHTAIGLKRAIFAVNGHG